jgi:uncharacterized membrane protein YoaK (UPF0700 family)
MDVLLESLTAMPPTRKLLGEVHDVVVPTRAGPHGPLPPLLLGLTVVTGLVDAFSYLSLGHVFVANMTGNVVFLGFAVAGASGFSIPASLVALGSFGGGGALVGGKVASRLERHRGHMLAVATSLQALLLGASVVAAAVSGDPIVGGYRYTLIVLLGVAMGIQNATARKLAVPDLTTTVLTLTITGVAADSGIAGGAGSLAGRRLVAVIAMFGSAAAGRPLPASALNDQDWMNVSRSLLMVSACVVGIPWGKPAYVFSVPFGTSSTARGPEVA